VYGHEEISNARLNEYDLVIAGGSVYVGKIQIAKWLNERKNILRNKNLFLFVVCASRSQNRKEQHQLLSEEY
jgi:menaquinone-dependent protoporphyrinogen IX oxidase